MIPYKQYAVIGGDLRQAYIANRLAESGKQVHALLLDENTVLKPGLHSTLACLSGCEAVILPMPLSQDDETIHAPFSKTKLTIEELFAYLPPNVMLFAGRVTPKVKAIAAKHHLCIHDYLQREELAVKNAGITAESAIALAINETPISLIGAHILVTGYGRISKALLQRLPAMGAQVTIAARSCADRAEIVSRGATACTMHRLAEEAEKADIIFNTVPAPLFTEAVLTKVKKDALLIDLASKPGGVAFDVAGTLGVRTIWALSLPGKSAPYSAGDIIIETIENCLAEQEAD